MVGRSSFGQRITQRAASMVENCATMVDNCATIAAMVGCKEATVDKIARVAKIGAEFGISSTATVGGLIAERVADRLKRVTIIDEEGTEEGNVTLEGYGSDGEPEEVRAFQHDVAAEIYKYIQMSKAAYGDERLAKQFDFVKESTLIHNVGEASKFVGTLLGTDTEVHVCILDESTAAFAFRGTEFGHSFKALLDWRSWVNDGATDLNILQRPVKLYNASRKPVYRSEPEMTAHKGFQLSLRDVTRTRERKDNLLMVLEDMGMKASDVKTVVCVGHSLGGALATLCAKWCREVAFPDAVIKCVTVGSPRVGNSAFARDFNTRVVNESYRVVNRGDLVPCVPHYSSGYKHVRGGIYLAKHPTMNDAVACTWGGIRSNIRTLSIRDHSLLNYLASFEKVLSHPHPHR